MVDVERYPRDPERFFPWLKRESEKLWESVELKRYIYGFQFQAGTKWNPGLNDGEIARFENEMGFEFPNMYKLFLKTMNGTDKDTINIYGSSGEPARFGTGYYAYPKDIDAVREMIDWIYESCNVTSNEVEATRIPHILPVVSHRFLVVDRCSSNPVLSMHGNDIIPYATDLMAFLFYDIFLNAAQDPCMPGDLRVTFWL